jgi:hypothetical protein
MPAQGGVDHTEAAEAALEQARQQELTAAKGAVALAPWLTLAASRSTLSVRSSLDSPPPLPSPPPTCLAGLAIVR